MIHRAETFEDTMYIPLVNKILTSGEHKQSRAGNTKSLFAQTFTIDMQNSFPILSYRKMYLKPVLGELAALLRGPQNIKDFKVMGCNYWDKWAKENGDIKLDYGNAWINFNGVNQLQEVVNSLINNRNDRRMLVTGWRPDRLAELSLPCCHLLYQWYVSQNKYLDMIWYQRSADVMVGLPSDIMFASALNILLANQCGLVPRNITFVLGDTHIYENHFEPTKEYLDKARKNYKVRPLELCRKHWSINTEANINTFMPDMLEIYNYNPLEQIKFELNV